MRKTVILITFILALTLSLFIGCNINTKTQSISSSSTKYNASSTTSENKDFLNYSTSMENAFFGKGAVAEADGYTYTVVNSGRFFRTKNGETKMQRYLQDEMENGYEYSSVNVVGDWIYYLNDNSNTLYKIKKEPKNAEDRKLNKLVRLNVRQYVIYKGLLYYIPTDKASIYKMPLNYAKGELVVDGGESKITDFIIDNDKIFYTTCYDENRKANEYLYCANIDGTATVKTQLPEKCFVSQDWGYYIDYTGKTQKLYRQNIKSNVKEKLTDKKVTSYIKKDNIIYFVVSNYPADNFSVYKLDIGTKAESKLMDSTVLQPCSMNCSQDYLFIGGREFEGPYYDFVRLSFPPISEKPLQERFVLDGWKWGSYELDEQQR